MSRMSLPCELAGEWPSFVDVFRARTLNDAEADIARLRKLLSEPPTWLCGECRDQWIRRDEAENERR